MKMFIFGLILLISYVQCANLRIDPLVLIQQGLVRGQRATDGDYTTFLGIPYAVVDEDNPFGPATPHTAFEEQVYKAYNGSIACPQTPLFNHIPEGGAQSLDCLRLNIYVPNEATSKAPLPVLVWIHGGLFGYGFGGEFGVRDLVKQGILVVTVNYRLGPYGFMCLNTPTMPGNQGLKDQFMALRWIRNNIASFGGNPYNVTLAGQSAGACSAILHLYSSREKLYHKVIAESGTPLNPGLFVDGDANAAIKLANYLGMNTSDTDSALKFLATSPHTLVTGAASALNIQFRACKEKSFSGVDHFVDSDPYSMTNERKIRNTPILIGHTSKENINTIKNFHDYFNRDPFFENVANNFNFDSDKLNKVASTIRHFYIGDKGITEQVTSKLEDFESDFVFNHPIQVTAMNLLKENANPVYEYMFSYVGESGEEGAGHSSELNYLFNMLGKTQRTAEDQLIADRITSLWANFVKFGNPTPRHNNPLSVTWNPISTVTRPYLVIDKDIRLESRVYNERMAFWELFHDNYGTYNKHKRQCTI